MISLLVSRTSAESGKAAITALNSVVLYLLAYLLVHGLHQLATVSMAARLGIRSVWHLSRIQFQLTDAEWWRGAVVAVYGAGPAVCAGLGVGAFVWFARRARGRTGLFKLFLLWVALHACNSVLGAMVAGTLTESGFWYVPSWVFLAGNVPNVIVAILCGLVQLGLGYFAAFPFLQCHDSRLLMKYQHRRRLLVTTVLVPWLGGSALLALLKWPDLSTNEELHFLTMALLLAPLSLACANLLFENTVRAPRKTRVAWGLVAMLVLLVLAWRLVLSRGLLVG